jgi:hypothetical protein
VTGKKLTKRSDKMDGASAEKNFFEREQLPSHKPSPWQLCDHGAESRVSNAPHPKGSS